MRLAFGLLALASALSTSVSYIWGEGFGFGVQSRTVVAWTSVSFALMAVALIGFIHFEPDSGQKQPKQTTAFPPVD